MANELVDPIKTPDGKTLRTLKDAAEYMLELPKKEQGKPTWQRAAKVLHDAAEHGGPFVFIARISFAKAMLGEDESPIGNPERKKGHRWGKRKLARDR